MSISQLLSELSHVGQELSSITKLNSARYKYYSESPQTLEALNRLTEEIGHNFALRDNVPTDQLRIRMPSGGGFLGLVPRFVASALLRLSAERGTPAAMEWLSRIRAKRATRERAIIGVHGLTLPSAVDIGGVRLLPLSLVSESTAVQAWLARGIAAPEIIYRDAVAVLECEVTDWLVSEVDAPDFARLQEWRRRCETILSAVGYAECGSPSLGEMWGEYLDPDLEQLGIPSGYTWQMEDAPRTMSAVTLTSSGIEAAERHLVLTGTLRAKLDVAAARLAIARRRIGGADRAIDVSIAFEALLGDDRFDLTYKLGLRSARMLAGNLEDRKIIRKTIKNFLHHPERSGTRQQD